MDKIGVVLLNGQRINLKQGVDMNEQFEILIPAEPVMDTCDTDWAIMVLTGEYGYDYVPYSGIWLIPYFRWWRWN